MGVAGRSVAVESWGGVGDWGVQRVGHSHRPASNRVDMTIPVGRSLDSVAVAYGSVWVVDSAEWDLARIDPAAGRVAARWTSG